MQNHLSTLQTIDIVMTTWKRENLTLLSLNTLKENTTYPYRIILVDNGSDEYIKPLYYDMVDVYVDISPNKGLEYAKHEGMKHVKSDLFISTDNDILVPELGDRDWLEQLIKVYQNHEDYKAIALRPQVLVGTGDIFKDAKGQVLEFSHVPGYMRIMDTEMVKDLGAWSDKRPLRGHEEYWISQKIRDKGYKVGWSTTIPCYHMFGDGNWGYGDMEPADHGHNPVQLPGEDWDMIRRFI